MKNTEFLAISDFVIICTRLLIFFSDNVFKYTASVFNGSNFLISGPTTIDAIILALVGISLSGQSNQSDLAGLAASAASLATGNWLLIIVGIITFCIRLRFSRPPEIKNFREIFCDSDNFRDRILSSSLHQRSIDARLENISGTMQQWMADQARTVGTKSGRKN